ncbi:MAG: anti-sigma F factor [Firmicutes bacterium]|nr:anti-sigma F factor [Bacillota bacterium]
MEAAERIHEPETTCSLADPVNDSAAVNRLELRFLSRPENVSLARLLTAAAVAERELTLAELDEIKVAVSEAVSNAIIHGYQGREDGCVALSLTVSAGQLRVSVSDEGVGMADVEQALRPNWSASGRLGLGFAFMHSFMDRVEVTSRLGQGTRVVLYKDLP